MGILEFLILYSIFTATSATIIVNTRLLDDIRIYFEDRAAWIPYILRCPICLSFWISFGLWLPILLGGNVSLWGCILYSVVTTGGSLFVMNRLFIRE